MSHHLVTFVSPKGRPPMTDAALVIQAHGGTIRKEDWVEKGIAYDIEYEGGEESEMRFMLQCLADRSKVDCIVQPSPRRAKKLFVSDMDSTIIEQECIDELANLVGAKKKVAAITARAMNGEIPFEDALRERVALLEGVTESDLKRVLDEAITLMPGAATLVATLRAHGIYCVLVSGGFTFFTGAIAKRTGFDTNEANRLEIKDGKLTGRVIEPILGKQAKLETLQRFAREQNITMSKTIAIGDGANDLPMLKEAGLGIAYHAKPTVEAECPTRIRYNDLTALLYVLGYPKDEWVIPA